VGSYSGWAFSWVKDGISSISFCVILFIGGVTISCKTGNGSLEPGDDIFEYGVLVLRADEVVDTLMEVNEMESLKAVDGRYNYLSTEWESITRYITSLTQ
jgi:hypothetical protein